MVPTPAGKEYLDFVRLVLVLNQELDARITSIPHTKNTLRVGFCLNSISAFQNTIMQFSKLYPDIQLSLTEDFSVHINEMLMEGELNLIFPTNFSSNPNMVIEPFSRADILLYIPENLFVPPPKTVSFSAYP